LSDPRKMMCVWKRTRQWQRLRKPSWLLSLRFLRCSRAVIVLFPAALLPVPLADPTPRARLTLPWGLIMRWGLMMIRCSGLRMGLWMFLPGWHGRKRNWRP